MRDKQRRTAEARTGALVFVVTAFLFRADASSVVQFNQIAVGAAVAMATLVTAIDAGQWLG